MSAIIRINSRALLQGLVSQSLRNGRLISTSPKNRETAAVAQCAEKLKQPETEVNKNWVSYGFDPKDKASDRSALNVSFFFSVTLCIVWGTFIWAYLPDTQMRDWAQRQGYLELRRREQNGLDLISPNYIDPQNMKLPSDEELGDTEIII